MKETIIYALEESIEKIKKKDQEIDKMSRDYENLESDCIEIWFNKNRFGREKSTL